MSGTQDLVIAAGIESMSRCPMGINARAGVFDVDGPNSAIGERPVRYSSLQPVCWREMIAKNMATRSVRRLPGEAISAVAMLETQARLIKKSSPSWAEPPMGVKHCISTTRAFVTTPAWSYGTAENLMEDGALTAANASQICDGSSAVMIASEQALKDHNLTPLARIHNLTVTAGDPVIMLEEPLFATDRALKRAGMSIHDMDLYEVNEALLQYPWLGLSTQVLTQTSSMSMVVPSHWATHWVRLVQNL